MEIKEIKRLEDGKPYAITVVNDYDNLEIRMKWDGCIDINKYSNGDTPENYSVDNVCYMHICEVQEFINELQSVVNIAKENFSEDDFKNYWG